MTASPINDLTRGLGRVVYSEAEIRQRIAVLGAQISSDYAGCAPPRCRRS